MTLTLYIARRFLVGFGLVLSVFFAILFLVEMVEQVRAFGAQGTALGDVALVALLNVPGALYRILPLVTILATIALFLSLARTSELVVTRAAGRSALVTLMAPVVTAALIGTLAVAALNPVVAATTKRSEALSERYRAGEGNALSVSAEGLWLRQGGADGQTVIHAVRSNADGTILQDVTFIDFTDDKGAIARTEARAARLAEGAWVLTDAKAWRFDGTANPELAAVAAAVMEVPSDLTAARISDSFGDPSVIPVWELQSFITALERAGFAARKHQVWLQMELALPLLLSAMVLVGAGFTMRHARSGGTGLMVLFALIAGFSIFFLRNFAQVLGENGQIPVLLAAWSAPVAATLLSLGLLLHMEEG
jgi:lipopolysaccharide export system permease protein